MRFYGKGCGKIMIKKELIDRICDAANMQRWNDHVRPMELTELDKQAHKMVIAYVLAKFEETERRGREIRWINLIEGGIFEFLQRVVLTDIKPPVFHRMIMKRRNELNEYVQKTLEKDISGLRGDFKRKFIEYLSGDDYSIERRILKAAHYLATNWEFRIIYNVNPFIYGIEKTKAEIENQIEDHYDLIGVQRMFLGKKSFGFIDLCGQLRFQQRWATTPRIPKTSVLGHMLIVAMLSYFCSIEIGACPKRIYNNFFAGLFHDLPEVLTRDIISPVKKSVRGLQEVIKEYEQIQIEETILPLLPSPWHKEIKYFIEDEFVNKIIENGEIKKGIYSCEEINEKYNEDKYSPLDGKLLKACDNLAAFIEASKSIEYGIKSPHLEEAKKDLYKRHENCKIAGIDFGQMFSYFN